MRQTDELTLVWRYATALLCAGQAPRRYET